MMKKLPELLCPAGSPEAFDAAIEGGADAIYLGGAAFNARMHAKNFGGDDLRSAVLRAHAFGVKVYLTLNTLITQRELPAYLDAAGEAAHAGVDALIVADLGGASAIRRVYPKLELHASTQMSGHNAYMGRELQKLGFSRMVVARETSSEDLRRIVSESPIEVEAFVHGALCVSHSGQCLFSSLVGGGGSPLASIQLGRGNREEASRIMNNGFVMLLFFALILNNISFFHPSDGICKRFLKSHRVISKLCSGFEAREIAVFAKLAD